MHITKNLVSAFFAAALSALLVACAGIAAKTPEDAVRARVEGRWKALLAGDFKSAYDFLAPASRAVVPFERFRAGFGAAVSWKAASVRSVSCTQADRCVVQVDLTYQPMIPRTRGDNMTTAVEETWLLEAGQWWLPYKF